MDTTNSPGPAIRVDHIHLRFPTDRATCYRSKTKSGSDWAHPYIESQLAIRLPATICLLTALGGSDLVNCQDLPPQKSPSAVQAAPPVPSSFREQASQNAGAPCLEPPPLPSIKDYNGPMAKLVGLFARTLERKSVHRPRYKPGVVLCAMKPWDKFMLFVDDSTDPVTFLSAGFDAGMDQAADRDPTFGQGAEGYGKRFGATLTDRVSSSFFKDFAYPAIFDEDPRYYRLGQGSTGGRLLHAAEHMVVAHHSDGTRMFNYSEWLGTASAVALNNIYHPGEERGVGAMSLNMGSRLAWDVGFDVLREFWPEIAQKFKLPFRGASKPGSPPPDSNGH